MLLFPRAGTGHLVYEPCMPVRSACEMAGVRRQGSHSPHKMGSSGRRLPVPPLRTAAPCHQLGARTLGPQAPLRSCPPRLGVPRAAPACQPGAGPALLHTASRARCRIRSALPWGTSLRVAPGLPLPRAAGAGPHQIPGPCALPAPRHRRAHGRAAGPEAEMLGKTTHVYTSAPSHSLTTVRPGGSYTGCVVRPPCGNKSASKWPCACRMRQPSGPRPIPPSGRTWSPRCPRHVHSRAEPAVHAMPKAAAPAIMSARICLHDSLYVCSVVSAPCYGWNAGPAGPLAEQG